MPHTIKHFAPENKGNNNKTGLFLFSSDPQNEGDLEPLGHNSLKNSKKNFIPDFWS